MISPSLVAELRTLKGGPKVTYPEGDASYPTTERVLNIKRGAHLPTFGQAEPDATRFPSNVLLEQQETGGDAQWVEVYRKYSRLPGRAITTTHLDDDGNAVTVTQQRVAVADIVTDQTLVTGVWARKYKGEGDAISAEQITESRSVPGNTIVGKPRLDYDGKTTQITRQRVAVGSVTTGSFSPDPGSGWIRNTEEPITDLVAWFQQEQRGLPGDPVTTTKYDADSDSTYTETRTLKRLSDITEGASVPGSGADSGKQVIIESLPIDAVVGYEIKKVFPDITANDPESAITLSEETLPFQFPATIDVLQYAASNGFIGYTKAFVRHDTPHVTKAFWVIGDKPSLTDYITPFELSSFFNFTLTGDPIGEVVCDTKTLHYGVITVEYPGSTPNLTDYLADYVGGDPQPVKGSVTMAGSRFRWKVELVYVQYLQPQLPTYS